MKRGMPSPHWKVHRWSGCLGKLMPAVSANYCRSVLVGAIPYRTTQPMFATPIIKTPQGQQVLEIAFGSPADADRLRAWQVSKNHPLSRAMEDALEFGRLAA